MSKYGLNLRGPQKKPPTKPRIFDDDDDDNVEKEILRHASKNKTLKDIEEQHKKALEEDPSVFDYDGVYDEMKEKVVRPAAVDRQERKPRYIQGLINKAKQREREHEIIYEKKLAKERGKDDHLFADKDKFVTGAYKRKLAENAKWMEEERIRQLREDRDDVTKKKDITDFYFNLSKNVAFGAEDADKMKEASKQQKDSSAGTSQERPPSSEPTLEPTKTDEKPQREGSSQPEERSRPDTKAVSGAEKPSAAEPKGDHEKRSSDEQQQQQPTDAEPKDDSRKRSLDAVVAAKARFLARKKAKDQKLFEAAVDAAL